MSPRSTSTFSADQLDAAAPVDEIEERDLAHLAPRHDAAGEPELLRFVLGARLELLGLRTDRSDLVSVGKALRQHRIHDSSSLFATVRSVLRRVARDARP